MICFHEVYFLLVAYSNGEMLECILFWYPGIGTVLIILRTRISVNMD